MSFTLRRPRVSPGIRKLLLGLLVLEAAYVATGVWLVRSGRVLAWLNKHPEKRTVTFESAWSVIPGLAHLSGVRVVNQGRGNQLELVVDWATAFVEPLELVGRRVHVLGLRARGVEFRFRNRPKTPEEAAAGVGTGPTIEGVPFEPYAGPSAAPAGKRGWTVVFTWARVREVRDIWWRGVRLKGSGAVSGSVTVGGDKTIAIRGAGLRYDGAELVLRGIPTLTGVDGRLSGRMERFDPKATRGMALLPLISGRLQFSGQGSAGAILSRYFGKAGWLEFESGAQRMVAKIAVDRGRIEPGGLVELEEALLGVRFAGFIAEGRAAVRLTTAPAPDGGAAAEVRVAYTDYGMRRLVEGPPVMKGTGLSIEARSPARLDQIPPEEFDGRIEFGKADFPDLTFVNELLPGAGGVAVKSGRATLEGGFDAGAAACRGQVTIATQDLVLDTSGVEHRGVVEMAVKVPGGNLRDGQVDLDDTHVAFRDFSFESAGMAAGPPSWQGRVTLTDGVLDLREGPTVRALLGLRFSDTRPLVAFLSRGKPLSGWKERLAMIEEITGEGVAEMQKGGLVIRHFGVHGGKVDIRFRGLVDSRGAFGKARARVGALKAGIGLEGKERDLTVVRVGTWYRRNDIRGMPPLLPRYSGEADDQ